jgi:multisubunit Na+/H+ antiporter MnhC subunit
MMLFPVWMLSTFVNAAVVLPIASLTAFAYDAVTEFVSPLMGSFILTILTVGLAINFVLQKINLKIVVFTQKNMSESSKEN